MQWVLTVLAFCLIVNQAHAQQIFNPVDPTAGVAPSNASFITRTSDPTLSNETSLSGLATGLLKNTTGTGVLSIAVLGTDYSNNFSNLNGTLSLSQTSMATARLLGRVTAGTGVAEEVTGTQATTLLDVFTSGLKGLAPASGGGTTNFLRADGTWAAPAGGGAHNLLSATHTDTLADTVVRGDIIRGNSTPAWSRLALGGNNLYLKSNGTDVLYSTLAAGGVGSCTNQFVTALNADAAPTCTTATLASAQFANQGTTTTVLHGNAAGNPSFSSVTGSDFASQTANFVFAAPNGSAGTPTFRALVDNDIPDTITLTNLTQIGTRQISDTTGTLAIGRGGTGQTTITTNQVFVGTALDTLTAKTLPSCSNGTTSKLLFDNATQTFSCGTDQTGGAGSANAVEVTIDFGSSGNDLASTVVTGQAWVTETSKIACAPTMKATASRAEGAEDAVIEGLIGSIHSRVASTGFTLTAGPRFGYAVGQYIFDCTGV